MINTSISVSKPFTWGKIILSLLACVVIFVFIAFICVFATNWMPEAPLKIVVRELLLRAPLTIYFLHFFAAKVIKVYNPTLIYGKINWLNTVKWLGISFALPLAVWLFYYLSQIAVPFEHTVKFGQANAAGIFITWSAISVAAGLTEEVMFRGHLFMILRSRCSVSVSVITSSFIFGLVHIIMLSTFSIGDALLVVFGGTLAGIMFSCIYRYSGSIWYAALAHGIWDIFFIGKIIAFVASQADADQTLLPFKLTTKSVLFTGGNFGTEAALPCLMVYVSVAVIVYVFSKKHNRPLL